MKLKLTSLVAGLAMATALSGAAWGKELRLSHQWSTKDIRHKVAQMVADDVAAANVDLKSRFSRQVHCSRRANSTSRCPPASWT